MNRLSMSITVDQGVFALSFCPVFQSPNAHTSLTFPISMGYRS